MNKLKQAAQKYGLNWDEIHDYVESSLSTELERAFEAGALWLLEEAFKLIHDAAWDLNFDELRKCCEDTDNLDPWYKKLEDRK